MQTFKRAMKAGEKDGPSLNHCLTQFLLRYRSTPHSTTNVAPSELFLGHNLHTLFDLLKPDIEKQVLSKQADQKEYHDKRAKPHYFSSNQPVMVRDFRLNTDKWIPGTVVESLRPVTYKVQVEGGNILKRHIDHMLEQLGTEEHTISEESFQYADMAHTPSEENYQHADIGQTAADGQETTTECSQCYPQ